MLVEARYGRIGVTDLPADRTAPGYARTGRPVELDGALQVLEAGALLERLLPTRPATKLHKCLFSRRLGRLDMTTHLDSSRARIATATATLEGQTCVVRDGRRSGRPRRMKISCADLAAVDSCVFVQVRCDWVSLRISI